MRIVVNGGVNTLEAMELHLSQVDGVMLWLYHGQPNTRTWRRMLSDADLLAANRPELLFEAMPETEAIAA